MTDPQDQLRLAAIFAENVRRALRHLPTETVADLTDGIEADIASSLSDGASLPSIDEYTADLLRGAGIDPPKISELDEKPHYFTRIFSCIKNLTLRVFEFLSPLAPAWWLFRAWVVTQVLGWMICDTDSIRPFVNQWGENALVGIIVFVCVVVLSVKLGRQKRFVAATTTVNIALLIFGLVIGFSQPMAHNIYYQDPNSWPSNLTVAPFDCQAIQLPYVVGMSSTDAVEVLYAAGFGSYFVDQELMQRLDFVPKTVILQQDPTSSYLCDGSAGPAPVQLVVDLSTTASTTSSIATSTTTRPVVSSTTTTLSTTTVQTLPLATTAAPQSKTVPKPPTTVTGISTSIPTTVP
ncbi:MAG: hypothetical protein NTZ76_11455 [Actinobacteria bacterium]|nr:hypothetical protein [Actinomycetota bacterium]